MASPHRRRGRQPRVMDNNLTIRETKFIQAYTDADGPGYLNGTRSAQIACDVTTERSAEQAGSRLLHRPVVQVALRTLLEDTDIKDQVKAGMMKIVKGFVEQDAYKAKDFTDAARFVAEVCGDKQPERHLHVSLTPEDRDKEYEAITNLVQQKQQSTGAPTVVIPDPKP